MAEPGPGRLQRLLRPRSLAFVGGEPALTSLRQCNALGFEGDLWHVHPERSACDGGVVYRCVEDLPRAPDAALVAVNREATLEVVRSLSSIGAGAAVCYASGFAEVGGDGRCLSDELLAAADDMPIIGPNCYGVVSALTGAALWPDEQGLSRVDSGVAFVTQSGNIAVNLTMQQRGLDVAMVMALGNQLDVGVEECLDALVADPQVSAVAMHIEALTDVERFVAAAEQAHRRQIPLVALRTGSSALGADITASHTSSLAGDDEAYTALFERVGVRRVHSVPELLDTVNVMSRLGPLDGARTVSMSCSGGEASLVADSAGDFELDFADFGSAHSARIAATLNEFVSVSNPLDYHTFVWGDRDRLEACFSAVLDGPFDAAMLIVDFPRPGIDPTAWWETLEAICSAAAATGTPAVVAASMAENLPAEVIERAQRSGLAAVGSIEGAMKGLEAAAWWGRPRSGAVMALAPMPAGAVGGAGHCVLLDEPASKALLAAAGMAVPHGRAVPVANAAAATADLRFPVALKTVGPAHKTDSGGVRLGLGSPGEVGAAANDLASLADEVLVETMVPGGVAEILVNVRRCEPVGFLLTLGAGGTLVEVLRDTRSALLPVSPDEIEALLDELACRPLLDAHRGLPAADVAALIGLVAQVAALAEDDPDIVEIEINPVIVSSSAAVAADATITRRQAASPPGGPEPAGISGTIASTSDAAAGVLSDQEGGR